jgi:hypothetical protein
VMNGLNPERVQSILICFSPGVIEIKTFQDCFMFNANARST